MRDKKGLTGGVTVIHASDREAKAKWADDRGSNPVFSVMRPLSGPFEMQLEGKQVI